MNNPSKSIYDEAEFCGKAGFDFLDLTIEGPYGGSVEISRLRQLLDTYGLSITGHTDPCLPFSYPIQVVRDACLQELERCAKIFSALGSKVMNIHPCYSCPPAMRNDMVAFNYYFVILPGLWSLSGWVLACLPVRPARNHGLNAITAWMQPRYARCNLNVNWGWPWPKDWQLSF